METGILVVKNARETEESGNIILESTPGRSDLDLDGHLHTELPGVLHTLTNDGCYSRDVTGVHFVDEFVVKLQDEMCTAWHGDVTSTFLPHLVVWTIYIKQTRARNRNGLVKEIYFLLDRRTLCWEGKAERSFVSMSIIAIFTKSAADPCTVVLTA